jgi:hypothetical protein
MEYNAHSGGEQEESPNGIVPGRAKLLASTFYQVFSLNNG